MIITIFYMQGIYTYIPETKYVPREYSVAAMLLLLFIFKLLWNSPIRPYITGITFVFTFHMGCIFIVRPLYFRIVSASF